MNEQPEGMWRKLILLAIFVVGLLTIGYLSSNVRSQLRELETATSDNVQWNLSQLEVEYLSFLSEVERAQIAPESDLANLRRRFDVLYSRISTLQSGALYAVFWVETKTEDSLKELQALLEKTTPLIDDTDEALRGSLPLIERNTLEARQYARAIALAGIEYFSKQRDLQRQSVYETLANIAVLTIVLLCALLVLVSFLYRLNILNRRRAAQNEIGKSRMTAIVSTSLDAIIAVDRNGLILDFNGAAEEVFGYTEAEAIGAQMADLIIPEHLRKAHDNGMKHYLETGEKRVVGMGRVQLEGKRKSGEVFPVEFSIAEAKGKDGSIFISYLRDISKEVTAEKELKEARDAAIAGEKSKSRFLAVMSHEMRTPLNGLLGTMELLGDTKLTQQQHRFLDIMEKSGGQLLDHVNDVLDISRLEAGKNDFDMKIFDLNAMIDELVQSQSAAAQANSNTLAFSSSDDIQLLVETDRVRLHQVMLNLVGNAIKFTRNGKINIEVETLPDGRTLELRVTDSGIGIAEDMLEKIFDDFTTLDTSFGRRADGTGLGLGIARRITQALGGEIGAESEVGEGSLFWLRLPIVVPASHSVTPSELSDRSEKTPQARVTSPKKILLVEDNQINREVARSFLEGDHHEVTEAHDGKEGVALANLEEFDLILMDISMPEMDGIQATQALRAGDGPNKNTPIVALTAHALTEDVEQFLAAGMSHAIFKPIKRRTLREMLNGLDDNLYAASIAEDASRKPALIDNDLIASFQSDIGREKYLQLLDKFILEMDTELPSLSGDVEALPLGELAAKTHRLSGSAAMFGAVKLREHLKAIETEAKSNLTSDLHSHALSALDAWDATREELKTLGGAPQSVST